MSQPVKTSVSQSGDVFYKSHITTVVDVYLVAVILA